MERLRFLHIPKTAGSTLSALLRRQYTGMSFEFTGNIISDTNRYKALSEDDRRSIVLFTGHAPVVTGIAEVDQTLTITLIRDPVERVKSFCQHVSEGKSSHLRETFPPHNFNLDRFLESGNGELSNAQTKFLITDGNSIYPPIESMTPTQARDAALDTLFNKIFRFGLQEYFDESLIVFRMALNWNTPYYYVINKKDASKQIRFEERHLKRIAELNEIDMEVYRLAEEHFKKILNGIPFHGARVKLFQFANMANNMKNRAVLHILKSFGKA